jgi:hypothetical protein
MKLPGRRRLIFELLKLAFITVGQQIVGTIGLRSGKEIPIFAGNVIQGRGKFKWQIRVCNFFCEQS